MSIDNVSRIKERLGVVDVVGSYIKLDKAGANLKGKCPFHNEKTASFFVSPDRGTYKCFGCGAGGDIFTFVEQFEGVDFPGALKILAEKAGVELVKEDPRLKDERERLFKVMEEATLFFEKGLSENKEVLGYLENRGLKKETIKNFRIGFVRDDWTSLYDFLKTKNFNDSEMEEVGLIKKREKGDGFYDRFRGRVIFPIFDNSGRTIAFSGRIYKDDEKSAKYLNSPETVLFHKSKILYGYNFAKNDIRKRDFSILVEGQMDIIMSHQAGFTNAVATSGTALTGDHLVLLKRLSNKIAMAFDGDKAGLNAANKGAKLALGEGMEVKLVEIPEGLDPADFILKDKDGWVSALKNSVHIIDFNLNVLRNKGLDKRSLGMEINKIVLPLVSGLNSKIEQDYFVSKISAKTGISESAIWEDLVGSPKDEIIAKEEIIITQKKVLKTKNKAIRELSGILYWQKGLEESVLDIEKTETQLKEILGGDVFEKIENLSDEIKNEIIFEAENLYTDERGLKNKVEELFINLEKEYLKEERNKVLKKINDGDESDDNMKLYNELSKKIEKI
ncbi:DNA primase [Patescibacteria group bacterium]|nr:DNA primase [Patescibacteria group bacterium]